MCWTIKKNREVEIDEIGLNPGCTRLLRTNPFPVATELYNADRKRRKSGEWAEIMELTELHKTRPSVMRMSHLLLCLSIKGARDRYLDSLLSLYIMIRSVPTLTNTFKTSVLHRPHSVSRIREIV